MNTNVMGYEQTMVFLFHVLEAVFGCIVICYTSKETYPWPSNVLHYRRLASFTVVL